MKSGLDAWKDEALARCDELIRYYDKEIWRQGTAYQAAQIGTIILAALTPILILWNQSAHNIAPVMLAVPSAIAAVLAGLSGTFKWQQNWVRFVETREALKSEKVRFSTRAMPDYQADTSDIREREAEYRALSNFVRRMEVLTLGETSGWSTEILQSAQQPAATDQHSSKGRSDGQTGENHEQH